MHHHNIVLLHQLTFHYSAIKPSFFIVYYSIIVLLTFHYSAIKLNPFIFDDGTQTKLTFHYSAIKPEKICYNQVAKLD